MISIKEARKLIGKEADKLTDEQIKDIIRRLDGCADILFDRWKDEKSGGPTGAGYAYCFGFGFLVEYNRTQESTGLYFEARTFCHCQKWGQ